MDDYPEPKPCRKCGEMDLLSDDDCDLPGLCDDCLAAALWTIDPKTGALVCTTTGAPVILNPELN
jgi:hypothetical protein